MRERHSSRDQRERDDKRPAFVQRKRSCRFCRDENMKMDYKDPRMLRMFISERGKILPRRLTGNCAKHQRVVTTAVKRARILSTVPYTNITV